MSPIFSQALSIATPKPPDITRVTESVNAKKSPHSSSSDEGDSEYVSYSEASSEGNWFLQIININVLCVLQYLV